MEEGMGWGLPKQLGPVAFAVLVGDRKIRAERIEDASALFNVQVGNPESINRMLWEQCRSM
ncbi:hypothetical protein TNCV_761441, partial [Trichonephila clavipes]